MFEAKTQSEILEKLKNYYTDIQSGELSPIEGTFVGDNLEANSVEFEKVYAEMSLIIEACFATTSWGDYLTMRASEFGVDRKEAVKATGTVTVTGTGIVTTGSLFGTSEGIQFKATETVTAAGTADVKIEAVESGESGNVAAGTIKKIPVSISGINSVNNASATVDGYDEETDESLLKRFLLHVRNPITSGNSNHYKEWALSVSGVGSAQVIPLWNGNGTVKILIVDDNKDKASETLINNVAAYIETVRPIGATVTVATPEYSQMTVTANIKVNSQYREDYQSVLETAISTYFIDDGFDNGYVSLAQIGKVMLNTGTISDYDQLKLNGGTSNITLTSEELPRLKSLGVTVIE